MTPLPPDMMAPGAGGLPGILAASLVAAGMEPHDRLATLRDGLTFPTARRVCVVLVDGLGYAQLTERSGHFPFLRRRDVRVTTTVAPSTTAAAVTSFGTGLTPGETGMLGYTVREPEGRLLNLIRWDDGSEAMKLWQAQRTLAEHLAQPERFAVLAPARFAGSGLTVAALRGAREIPAETLEQRVDGAVAELRSGRADVAYVYWGEVDHAGHVHGWGSWEWGEEASRTDAELGRLAASLPADTLLVITADHGMIDVAARTDVATTPQLAEGVTLISGEPRASHLHTADPGGVVARWQDFLGDSALVLRREEALPLFGRVTERFRPVIGDVVVFMRGRDVVVDSRTQTPGSIDLVGVHGSLTRAEMEIPLIVEAL